VIFIGTPSFAHFFPLGQALAMAINVPPHVLATLFYFLLTITPNLDLPIPGLYITLGPTLLAFLIMKTPQSPCVVLCLAI